LPITVNADDFGISPEVNKAIVQSFEEGLINRTTLMANMPYAGEAMELAKQYGFTDKVGLHLNLTAGKPLTSDIAKDRVMCDAQGLFTADFARNMKTRFIFNKTTADNVRRELVAQLDRYRELGGMLWHIDSHHHVHTDPSVWKQLKKAMKDYPVRSVRLGRNMYYGGNILMRIFKVVLNQSIRSFCKVEEDLFGSAADFDEYAGKMKEAEKASFIDNQHIEIMVHPMYNTGGELTDSMEQFKRYL